MFWNPFKALRQKFGRGKPGEAKAGPTPLAAEAPKGEEFKELEKQGLLGQFFRRWKDPAFLKQLRGITARMQADGVNLKDKAAVKTWLQAHKKDLEEGKVDAPAAAPVQTYVKAGPDTGRNDPCPCGSGKKFKKCCGK